jgi:methionine synthase II (cobalamin-independent)
VLVQQCYGGFQIHYDGRIVMEKDSWRDGVTITDPKMARFTEPELELATQVEMSLPDLVKKLKEELIKAQRFDEAALVRDIEVKLKTPKKESDNA